jgi:hypothetical protein
MVQLGVHEDYTDNVLLEWAAALELHQRGRLKAVLPLLVGESDFFTDATKTFGGIQALPTHSSDATMANVATHLGETTGDSSVEGLHELLRQVTGQTLPGVQQTVACILKFQGIKLSESGTATAHSHGHMSVGTDDLRMCFVRVQETVSACLKRVGVDRLDDGGPPAAPPRPSPAGRLHSRRKKNADDMTDWDTPKH